MKRFVIVFVILLNIFFIGCKKSNEKLIDKATGEQIQIKVNRFEDVLFSSESGVDLKTYLIKHFEDYKYLFNTSLNDPEYFSMVKDFISDKEMQQAYRIVKKKYPNLDWLSSDITSAFARLSKEYPDIKIPKLYSLMVGPADASYAYSTRVVADTNFIAFAIDNYAINELASLKYYSSFPKYMMLILDSNFIAPDIIRTYLTDALTYDIPLYEQALESSLCDIIIERGKYLYATKYLLPSYEDNSIFRYSQEQMKWVESNEANIWAYIIKNNLLYERDRTKFGSLIMEGPSVKGLEGSAPRLGDWIGYRIVEHYMYNKDISLKELFTNRDSKQILTDSKYKPKK